MNGLIKNIQQKVKKYKYTLLLCVCFFMSGISQIVDNFSLLFYVLESPKDRLISGYSTLIETVFVVTQVVLSGIRPVLPLILMLTAILGYFKVFSISLICYVYISFMSGYIPIPFIHYLYTSNINLNSIVILLLNFLIAFSTFFVYKSERIKQYK